MNLIIASDPRGGIGYKNKLPWKNIQGDLSRFKKLTSNQLVVMGRKTWDSLPKKPLPNRLNFVLTTSKVELPSNVFRLDSLEHLKNINNVWLIGGASVVNQHWDAINCVHLSRTHDIYQCDAHIDLEYLMSNYSLTYEETNIDHTYEVWVKK